LYVLGVGDVEIGQVVGVEHHALRIDLGVAGADAVEEPEVGTRHAGTFGQDAR
jgi:hypothetical protein